MNTTTKITETNKSCELGAEELMNVSGGSAVGAGALLKACWDAAVWTGKKVWSWGAKFADWEDNGCEINGKKYCD